MNYSMFSHYNKLNKSTESASNQLRWIWEIKIHFFHYTCLCLMYEKGVVQITLDYCRHLRPTPYLQKSLGGSKGWTLVKNANNGLKNYFPRWHNCVMRFKRNYNSIRARHDASPRDRLTQFSHKQYFIYYEFVEYFSHWKSSDVANCQIIESRQLHR